ncbi:MAG: hypothetical protein AB7V46_08105 [Thermomicrobiales bacterium]
MKKFIVFLFLAAALIATSPNGALAQADAHVDPRFSDDILSTLGYQTLEVKAADDGFTVQSEIPAGLTLVTLDAQPDKSSYVDFMQPAAGLSEEEATSLALQSAREDIAHEGWTYGGGSYAVDGGEVSFVVNLTPGEWQVAASYQVGADGEEIMNLYPLTVTAAEETGTEPDSAVTIQLNDFEFIIEDGAVAAGPQVYEFTNVGEAPRQMVLWNSPRAITVEDYQQFFQSFDTGTPGPEVMSQLVWVGYHAIISPGQTVWLELDLDPGTYTTTSWVVDPETGAPALLLGMVANFTVE